MAKLPSLKARELIRVLRGLGFVPLRQRGSHIFFLNIQTGERL